LDPLGDGVDANKVVGSDFGVVWEEEQAHVMVDSHATSGVMDKQRGYRSPCSYLPEPFHETEALQYFLRFSAYELLHDWIVEITGRGRSKYKRRGDTFLSYDRECTPGMLLSVLGLHVHVVAPSAYQEGLLASE